jgi:hypothetical protein
MSHGRQIKTEIKEEPAVKAARMEEEPLVKAGEIEERPAGTTAESIDFIRGYGRLMAIQREREEAEAQEREHQIEKEHDVESTRMENCTDLATLRAYNMRLEAENIIRAERAEAQEARDEGGREAVALRKKREKEFAMARGAGSPWIQAV